MNNSYVESDLEFEIGDIVRYGAMKSELMKVTGIRCVANGGFRLLGQNCVGGTDSAPSWKCKKVTAEDMKLWKQYQKIYGNI